MSTLRGIVIKLFLAGFATTYPEFLSHERPDFLLESYWYLKKVTKIEMLQNFIKHNQENFILDSGAFTLLNNCKSVDDFLKNLDEYITDYIAFVKNNQILHYIEMDIDPIVGHDKVVEIRERIEREVGWKSIPVWHLSRGLEEWEKLTKEYDYIALGGVVTKEIKKKDYPKLFPYLLRIARKNNCKVHGLGFTQTDKLLDYDFYSVDSTSWTACVRFCRVSVFKNGRMIGQRMSDSRRLLVSKRQELLKFQIGEWIKYQRFLKDKRGRKY